MGRIFPIVLLMVLLLVGCVWLSQRDTQGARKPEPEKIKIIRDLNRISDSDQREQGKGLEKKTDATCASSPRCLTQTGNDVLFVANTAEPGEQAVARLLLYRIGNDYDNDHPVPAYDGSGFGPITNPEQMLALHARDSADLLVARNNGGVKVTRFWRDAGVNHQEELLSITSGSTPEVCCLQWVRPKTSDDAGSIAFALKTGSNWQPYLFELTETGHPQKLATSYRCSGRLLPKDSSLYFIRQDVTPTVVVKADRNGQLTTVDPAHQDPPRPPEPAVPVVSDIAFLGSQLYGLTRSFSPDRLMAMGTTGVDISLACSGATEVVPFAGNLVVLGKYSNAWHLISTAQGQSPVPINGLRQSTDPAMLTPAETTNTKEVVFGATALLEGLEPWRFRP